MLFSRTDICCRLNKPAYNINFANCLFCCSNPMMVTMSGVITDETQNVLNKDWEPIEGLYVAGNCLGGRYGFGYSTPFAGNSVGMAMTHGWTAGHQVASDKKFLGEPVEAMEAPAGGPGGPGGPH